MWYNNWYRNHHAHINSFAEAEKTYNDTKPVVSRNHGIEQDIRPLGLRQHKHRRIVKVSRDCYAILSGDEPIRSTWHMYNAKKTDKDIHKPLTTKEDVRKVATILWQRHRDGTESVSMRGGVWMQPGRHVALQDFLPYAMNVTSDAHANYYVNGYYLPKTGTKFTMNQPESRYWHGKKVDLTHPLTFRRKIGERDWGAPDKTYQAKRSYEVIDHKAKTPKRAKQMREFTDWAWAMKDLLVAANSTYQQRNQDRSAYTQQYQEAHGGVANFMYNYTNEAKYNRKILADPEHPARAALAALCLLDSVRYAYWSYGGKRDVYENNRSAFVKHLNQCCGYTKTKEVEV